MRHSKKLVDFIVNRLAFVHLDIDRIKGSLTPDYGAYENIPQTES